MWILNDWQEESEVVRSIAEQLLDCEVVLDDDPPRRLTAVDIIVVCPYNAQAVMIRRLRESEGFWVIEVLPPKPKLWLRAPAAHIGSTFYSHSRHEVFLYTMHS